MRKMECAGRSGGQLVHAVQFRKCPILVTMGVLGKKWTLLILRDIALLGITRFNQIRRSIPGPTSRVLVVRLHELEECGLIEAVVVKKSPRVVDWGLTQKGRDTIPILMSIMAFGIRWYPDQVFGDSRPRSLAEVLPADDLQGRTSLQDDIPAEG